MSTQVTETPAESKKRLRRVRFATVIGTGVEWYDFYLYGLMATQVFPHVFFSGEDTSTATLQGVATFAVGFLARPFGGILFGTLGDKIGRKRTLVFTFMLMGISTGVIGLLPSYATIGALAPIMLVVIRIAQGMGAGAEYASAAVVSYEHADPARRGRQGAWPALGLNLGLVASSLTVALLSLFGEDFLINGGWRIPFLLSFGLVGIGIYVRSKTPETPTFVAVKTEQVAQAKPPKSPLAEVFRSYRLGFLVVFLIAVGYNSITYLIKTYSLAYLAEYKDVSTFVNSVALTVSGVVAIGFVPIAGYLCDRYTSRMVLIFGGAVSVLAAFPFLALIDTGLPIAIYVAFALASGLLTPAMFSAQGSFLSRQFPPHTRSTGVGSAREIGTALSAGLIPVGALALTAASPTNSTFGAGLIFAVSGLLVVVAAYLDAGKRLTNDRN